MYLQRQDLTSLSVDVHSASASSIALTSVKASARSLKGVTERHVPHPKSHRLLKVIYMAKCQIPWY